MHAGDFSGEQVLDRFEAFGPPLVAVHGDVEAAAVRRRLPERAEFEWAGLRIGVIHDAGQRKGRLERMRRRFPGVDAVIFGHSHMPLHERAAGGFDLQPRLADRAAAGAPRRRWGCCGPGPAARVSASSSSSSDQDPGALEPRPRVTSTSAANHSGFRSLIRGTPRRRARR